MELLKNFLFQLSVFRSSTILAQSYLGTRTVNMGRVSRYRKISKDDPFAPKRPEKVDTTINFEPGKKDLKESGGGMTRSVARMIKAQERMKRNNQSTSWRWMVKELSKTPFDPILIEKFFSDFLTLPNATSPFLPTIQWNNTMPCHRNPKPKLQISPNFNMFRMLRKVPPWSSRRALSNPRPIKKYVFMMLITFVF